MEILQKTYIKTRFKGVEHKEIYEEPEEIETDIVEEGSCYLGCMGAPWLLRNPW